MDKGFCLATTKTFEAEYAEGMRESLKKVEGETGELVSMEIFQPKMILEEKAKEEKSQQLFLDLEEKCNLELGLADDQENSSPGPGR